MKIIDLLNKIANEEEVPKKIRYQNYIYEYRYRRDTKNSFNYMCNENGEYLSQRYFIDNILNDEVEIIEEEPRDIEVCGSLFTKSEYDKLAHSEEEKKIPEKLEDRARFQYSQIPYWFKDKELIKVMNENFEKHQKAIYEIIDYLKSKGE